MESTAYDTVGAIMEYEDGTLTDEGTLTLFQHLVNTGQAWQFQGSYGRTAAALIEAGLIQPAPHTKVTMEATITVDEDA